MDEYEYRPPSQKVQKLLDDLDYKHPDAQFSFSHIVTGDDNLDNHHIYFCLEYMSGWLVDYIKDNQKAMNWGTAELLELLEETAEMIGDTMKVFVEILKIPEDERYA